MQKAKVEIYVSYCGEEYSVDGNCDTESLYDDIGDLIADIDLIVRQEGRKREALKTLLKGKE
jgi:hypothetical protein